MIHHQSPGIDVQISSRAVGLWRAENDNRLLKDIPRPMSVRLAIFTGASLGLMACVVLMFAESVVRNS